jgi:Phage P22-like portal protein
MNNDAIIKLAVKRMDEATSSDLDNRERAQSDLQFIIGEQWPDDVRQERESEGKPCLTINGLPQFVRQVTGQIRQMNPAIRVVPSDSQATEEVAEIYAGLIKQIEYASEAASIYEGAAESAAGCGIGHWRIRADYAEGMTFDQELMIERIHNPFSVMWDPLAKEPTRKDARYCFITEAIDREDFRAQYPDADMTDATDENRMDTIENWTTTDTVTVAEYFWIEHEEQEIALLANGQIVPKPFEGMAIVKRRKVKVPKVQWAKITANEILEGPTVIPCNYIPVVAVTGEEWHLGEEMYRSSVIRFAKDPQQLYNFARSSMAEVMTLQPKAPYLVTTKQVAGLETFWNEANAKNRPYLPYHPDPSAQAPRREQPPLASQAISQEVALSADDMKRTTGIYDASLGAQSNEKSGVAIRERKMEAQTNNSVYADNMVKGITHTGRILVSMIPKVYDTQRVIRILGEDDQEKQVLINSLMVQEGQVVPVNDLTAGAYDVRITVGPSYESKRQEASEGMMAFGSSYPTAAPLIADLVAKQQDWPEADRVAERLRKALPPGLAEDDDQNQGQPDPAMQAQMQQQQMQMQQQQAAMEAEQAKMQAELRKANAEATEAEAKAVTAQAQAQIAAINAGLMPPSPQGAPTLNGY